MARRKARPPWPPLGKPIECDPAGIDDKTPEGGRIILEWRFDSGRPAEFSPKRHPVVAKLKQRRRMLKLLEHYEIPNEDWYALAVAIVSEFDEGARIIKTKHTPPRNTQRKWTRDRARQFLCNVRCELDAGIKPLRTAIERVKSKFPDLYADASAEHLEKQFHVLKKRLGSDAFTMKRVDLRYTIKGGVASITELSRPKVPVSAPKPQPPKRLTSITLPRLRFLQKD
jgi:hypothetical protein